MSKSRLYWVGVGFECTHLHLRPRRRFLRTFYGSRHYRRTSSTILLADEQRVRAAVNNSVSLAYITAPDCNAMNRFAGIAYSQDRLP